MQRGQQEEVARQKGKCTRVCAHAELLRQLFSFVTSVHPGVLSEVSDTWAAVEGKLGMCTGLSCRGERRASAAEGQPHVRVCVCACELVSRSSLVCRQVRRVPRGILSCVPAVFSLPQGSQVALQGDTGVCVCVCTHRDNMFLVSTV